MKICSYYTPDYKPVFEKHLGKSLKDLHIQADVSEEKSRGSWEANTNIKPEVILRALLSGQSVLYIDADAEITCNSVLRIDSLVPKNCIGAHVVLDHALWYGNTSDTMEPLSGTIYLRPAAINFVMEWLKLSQKKMGPDGSTYAKIFGKRGDMHGLGVEWAYIESLPFGGVGGIPCAKPLIVHYQQSRQRRNR